MSAPSPLKGGLNLGRCGFLCYWGGFCIIFVDIVIGDTIDPQVIVYFPPFHVGVADELDPELLVIEEPAQPGVGFRSPDYGLQV